MTAVAKELGYDIRKDFSSLESIWVVTENFPLQWGIDMENIWNVTLHDGYGSTQQETLLGCTCEKGAVPDGKRGFMHVFEDYTIVEVLNRDTRDPVKSGEWGEVVITTLGREASPVVRYATNDRVMFLSHTECNCGRPFNGFQAGTISRYDDMLKIKGVNIWPQTTDEVIFAYNEIEEYNGKVIIGEGGKEEAVVLLEFKREVPENKKVGLVDIISKELHNRTGIRMKVIIAKEGVKHFEFKPQRWEDERGKGLDIRRI
jgi:phenylacetate-CoA ligase